jgi:hypothetical protein
MRRLKLSWANFLLWRRESGPRGAVYLRKEFRFHRVFVCLLLLLSNAPFKTELGQLCFVARESAPRGATYLNAKKHESEEGKKMEAKT